MIHNLGPSLINCRLVLTGEILRVKFFWLALTDTKPGIVRTALSQLSQ